LVGFSGDSVIVAVFGLFACSRAAACRCACADLRLFLLLFALCMSRLSGILPAPSGHFGHIVDDASRKSANESVIRDYFAAGSSTSATIGR
jgi:hypothetical protein